MDRIRMVIEMHPMNPIFNQLNMRLQSCLIHYGDYIARLLYQILFFEVPQRPGQSLRNRTKNGCQFLLRYVQQEGLFSFLDN